MQSDNITSLGSSLIQHGKNNNRIYLMKLAPNDSSRIINELDRLAQDNNYTKIFAKVPETQKNIFIQQGYIEEAVIPHFFLGSEDVYFMAKYFSEDRAVENNISEINTILEACKERKNKAKKIELSPEYDFRICGEDDAKEMALLYKEVFASYPFPIFDQHYIVKTMQRNIVYFGIWYNGKPVALSSAEMDIKSQNAEMTDFATLPSYRGQNLASFLLKRMEEEMKRRNIKTVYTIARAHSWGMNLTFAGLNFSFTGILINNTNIGGSLESMNVWYKNLF